MTENQAGDTLPPPRSLSCYCHSYIYFLFDSFQTAEERGLGGVLASSSVHRSPLLCGAVYNSRMWDSQKETPNRTSCGYKIPRCQELKIAALEPQPPRGGGEGACLLWRKARGSLHFQPSALWVSSCGAVASHPLVADLRPPIWAGASQALPACQPSLCLQRPCAACFGLPVRGCGRAWEPLERSGAGAPLSPQAWPASLVTAWLPPSPVAAGDSLGLNSGVPRDE